MMNYSGALSLFAHFRLEPACFFLFEALAPFGAPSADEPPLAAAFVVKRPPVPGKVRSLLLPPLEEDLLKEDDDDVEPFLIALKLLTVFSAEATVRRGRNEVDDDCVPRSSSSHSSQLPVFAPRSTAPSRRHSSSRASCMLFERMA